MREILIQLRNLAYATIRLAMRHVSRSRHFGPFGQVYRLHTLPDLSQELLDSYHGISSVGELFGNESTLVRCQKTCGT